MAENIFYPKEGTNPFIKNLDEYKDLYKQSIDNPSEFFGNLAKENIQWIEEFDTVHNGEFSETKWFEGGKTISALIVLIGTLKIMLVKLPLFGKAMIQMTLNNFLIKSCMMKYVNLLMY